MSTIAHCLVCDKQFRCFCREQCTIGKTVFKCCMDIHCVVGMMQLVLQGNQHPYSYVCSFQLSLGNMGVYNSTCLTSSSVPKCTMYSFCLEMLVSYWNAANHIFTSIPCTMYNISQASVSCAKHCLSSLNKGQVSISLLFLCNSYIIQLQQLIIIISHIVVTITCGMLKFLGC